MKKYIYIYILFILFASCTDRSERDEVNFNVKINNTSSEYLIIEGYAPNNDLVINNVVISSNSIGAECNYRAEIFSGYICGADSIVFKFPNGKGYICDLRQSGNIFCFPNKTPFGNEASFVNLDNRNYQFLITEDDYINAYDLP